MGKKSEVSLNSKMNRTKDKVKISTNGIRKRNRKRRKNLKKNISNLFKKLRNSAETSNINNTVIEIVDNTQEPDETQTTVQPIVIDDEFITNDTLSNVETPRSDINMCPIQCSTPKSTTINNNSLSKLDEDANVTREINNDSYLTIDLTADSTVTSIKPNIVIDLVNNTESIDSSISMSGDSDVTVINTRKKKINNNQMRKFVNGIEQMDSSERGKLLEVIAQKIFSGCNGPRNISSLHSFRNEINRTAVTVEDVYIKEVILRKTPSRNSIGSNIYNPERDVRNKSGLRMVVIDGSNVAMQHSKGRVFSVKGLKICIDYFTRRGHTVKAFVPHFRCKFGKSTDGRLLDQLERQGLVVYTPSREVQGRLITSYDDRYIVQCAAEFDGVIVSGDNYRDLLAENPRWRNVIENRLLQFTWVGDMIMFPRDPLGRDGPTLEMFLRHPLPNEHR